MPQSNMAYRSLRACVLDLERHGHLRRISVEMDPHLEMAEVQRRVYRAGGPALLFERVQGTPFPAVSNLFGTKERGRFIFRETLARTQAVIRLKADPTAAIRAPWKFWWAPSTGLTALPRKVRGGPVLANETTIASLPAIKSWPRDGGPFITLPQVLTEHPGMPGIMQSNLGMYRVQLSGNAYTIDRDVGLHYQIHRGIGVHHTAAAERGEPLRVSIFVGGPPAHTFAAVMPLPEGLSELVIAGMLSGRRFRWTRHRGYVVSSDADFCIVGTIDPTATKPEGPFGDHLGYYSLEHPFPVMRVEAVYHRDDAIWPFTVVGRPPQEDTTFGALIHELTAPMVPVEIPGVRRMHAVDEAGVHPLLLAVGSERYLPYAPAMPRELLTQANALLGFNQASLAKYLIMAAEQDAPGLDVHDVAGFLDHVLARFDPRRDLHFQTQTTMDTLDYSGSGLHQGSKLVLVAVGPALRTLARSKPAEVNLPAAFGGLELALPGVLVVSGTHGDLDALRACLGADARFSGIATPYPLVVVVDDAAFTASSLANFLWVTFTRSNPSHDVHGVAERIREKHWGCEGSVIVDARLKSHHAPPLVEDPEVGRRLDALAVRGGPLHGLWD